MLTEWPFADELEPDARDPLLLDEADTELCDRPLPELDECADALWPLSSAAASASTQRSCTVPSGR